MPPSMMSGPSSSTSTLGFNRDPGSKYGTTSPALPAAPPVTPEPLAPVVPLAPPLPAPPLAALAPAAPPRDVGTDFDDSPQARRLSAMSQHLDSARTTTRI